MPDDTPGLLRRALGRGRRLVDRARGREAGLPPGTPVEVCFSGDKSGQVPVGWSLLAAARHLDVDLDHFCGGNSSCGTCRVSILQGAENLSSLQVNEEIVLGVDATRKGDRLACQARLRGPVTVRIPEFFMVK
ncbi:MAG: (2Fe-2S)-binding protein [Alphaproteobacteria bacterium]|nr:(2Fe-2S)-binding protein [Alphaproteobacteria bacterium]